MDGWRPPSAETTGKFYVLWRGQVVHAPDKKIRLFDTEREALGFWPNATMRVGLSNNWGYLGAVSGEVG